MSDLPPRLIELIRRDLGALRVDLVAPSEDPPAFAEDDAPSISATLPRGYRLVVEFARGSDDREALARRLDTIVSSFWESLSDALPASTRPPVSDALQRELRALVDNAGAVDAVIIDAMSSVIWADADAAESTPHVEQHLAEVIPFDRSARSTPPPPPPERTRIEQAIQTVRALPAMTTLPKGGHLSHHDRDAEIPYAARSLASIYVLVLLFDAPFDELRAERAVHARLEAIERLVVALPPLDPTPLAGAKAMRARRT